MVSNLALFCLATVLATFQKNWVIFLQIIWSPCLRVRPEPTQVNHPFGASLSLPTNTKLGWKGLPGAKTLAYLAHS